MVLFVEMSTKKAKRSLALHYLYLRSILEKLKYLISPIHHKEGDCHYDVNDEEGQNSRDPRLEHVKTITKESWTDSCQNVASGLGKPRQLGCLFRGASFDGEANHEIREKSATGGTNQEMRY